MIDLLEERMGQGEGAEGGEDEAGMELKKERMGRARDGGEGGEEVAGMELIEGGQGRHGAEGGEDGAGIELTEGRWKMDG